MLFARLLFALVAFLPVVGTVIADDKSPPPLKETKMDLKEAKPEREIQNSVGMKFVLIRAGNFRMGTADEVKVADTWEKPQHRVQITRPYYLGKFEVTRGEFRKFVEKTDYQTEAERSDIDGVGYSGDKQRPFVALRGFNWRNTGREENDNYPVVNVSWNDAVAFCEWLTKVEGKEYRLPTEAEWEWACRGGTIGPWSFGDKETDLPKFANVLDLSAKAEALIVVDEMQWNDGFPFTAEVGKFKPNPFGLYDMHGNVTEWCQDKYSETYYAVSPIKDPRGPEESSTRVVRGGSWYLRAFDCRSACRAGTEPFRRFFNVGFRVALTPPSH